jgi:hypothetical protein
MAMARKVTTPDGIAWTIRRRWLPHRKVRWRRLRVRGGGPAPANRANINNDHWYSHVLDFLDIPDFGDLGDVGTVIAVIVCAIIAGLLLWFLVIPAVLAVLDLVLVLLLLVAGLFAHLVLGRPWEVQASCSDRRVVWLVTGWRRSQSKIIDVEDSLRAGTIPSGSITQ